MRHRADINTAHYLSHTPGIQETYMFPPYTHFKPWQKLQKLRPYSVTNRVNLQMAEWIVDFRMKTESVPNSASIIAITKGVNLQMAICS